jgi:hypothetical protein
MNETWRFITIIALLIVVGALLPFVVEASGIPVNIPELN